MNFPTPCSGQHNWFQYHPQCTELNRIYKTVSLWSLHPIHGPTWTMWKLTCLSHFFPLCSLHGTNSPQKDVDARFSSGWGQAHLSILYNESYQGTRLTGTSLPTCTGADLYYIVGPSLLDISNPSSRCRSTRRSHNQSSYDSLEYLPGDHYSYTSSPINEKWYTHASSYPTPSTTTSYQSVDIKIVSHIRSPQYLPHRICRI